MELPLALLPFAFIFASFVDVVHVTYLMHSVEQRVRVGARFAATHGADLTTVRNMVLYNAPSAPVGAHPFLGLAPESIQVVRLDMDTPDDRLRVSISGLALPLVSPWLRRTLHPGPVSAVAVVESLGTSH